MSNQQTKNVSKNLPAVDDGGLNNNDRVIQGTIVRCVDGHWADRDGISIPQEAQMLALATRQVLQRWHDQTPVETITKHPLPDVEELNAQIPQDEWEEGLDGNPRAPWVRQHIVYLLDPHDASLFTFINSTVGAQIAVERIAEKMKWMAALRGERVVPLVKLDTKPMTTRFGQKMRPEFTVIDWRKIGVDLRGEVAPQIAPSNPKEIGEPVEPISSKKEFNDEIPF